MELSLYRDSDSSIVIITDLDPGSHWQLTYPETNKNGSQRERVLKATPSGELNITETQEYPFTNKEIQINRILYAAPEYLDISKIKVADPPRKKSKEIADFKDAATPSKVTRVGVEPGSHWQLTYLLKNEDGEYIEKERILKATSSGKLTIRETQEYPFIQEYPYSAELKLNRIIYSAPEYFTINDAIVGEPPKRKKTPKDEKEPAKKSRRGRPKKTQNSDTESKPSKKPRKPRTPKKPKTPKKSEGSKKPSANKPKSESTKKKSLPKKSAPAPNSRVPAGLAVPGNVIIIGNDVIYPEIKKKKKLPNKKPSI